MRLSVNHLPKDKFTREVSLAEVRFGMDRNDIQRLPLAGFWMPASEMVKMSIVFASRLPLDYAGNIIWPQPTATSDNDADLNQALGLDKEVYAEIWAGQFSFDAQCFRLTTPEEASHVLLYTFSTNNDPVWLEAFVEYKKALWGEETSFLEADGSKTIGCAAFFPVDGLGEILQRHGENYRKRLRLAEKTLSYTTEQRMECRHEMENLMENAIGLDWSWQPLTYFAIIYYINGKGLAARETFSYTKRDVNRLRNLICIAEENNSGGVD